MKYRIGIDLSLRSAGITVVDERETLVEIYVHQPKKLKDEVYEELLINNCNRFKEIIIEIIKKYDVDRINLEGLSFNSLSSTKDLIDAQWWLVRIFIYNLGIKLKIFSPANWRKINKIKDSKIKLKQYKEELGKDYWKILALGKLNQDTHDKIIYYCEDHKLRSKTEFDIADSYWIACCK